MLSRVAVVRVTDAEVDRAGLRQACSSQLRVLDFRLPRLWEPPGGGEDGGAGGADEATSAEDASSWRVGGTEDLVQTRLEEWEAGRPRREVTQEEGPSRRQKV